MSVQARLVRHAKATGMDPNHVLARYATERFLYRLSSSQHAATAKVPHRTKASRDGGSEASPASLSKPRIVVHHFPRQG